MSTFYTIDSANARIPEIREILLVLQTQRRELIRLRERLIRLDPAADDEARTPSGNEGNPGDDVATGRPAARPAVAPEEEARLIRLRMQGTADQMQASVAQIDGWGITLRDIETGLIDFPALVMGRQIWLCWRLGEGELDWWHELNTGVAGRRRLRDLA